MGMRLKTKLFLGCIAASVLSSCATTAGWVHQSKDAAALDQDDAECLGAPPENNTQADTKEGGTVYSESYAAGAAAGRSLRRKILGEKYSKCMIERGWQKTKR